MDATEQMSDSDLESLRNRLDSLGKRAGSSTILAEMLTGRLAAQEREINAARTSLEKTISSPGVGDQVNHNKETVKA
jgi:hypothetical protein